MSYGYTESAHRLLKFHLMTRVLILLSATVTAALWSFAPGSLTAELDDFAGQHFIQMAFFTLISIGWLDVIVNDILPESIQFDWAREKRHLIFSLIGLVYLLKAFVGAGAPSEGAWVLLIYYTSLSFICIWYTFAAVSRPKHAL